MISEGVLWMADESFVNGPLEEDIVHMGSIDRYYAKDSIRIGITELLDDTNPLESRNPNELITFIYDPQERPDRGFGVTYGAYSYFFRTTLHYLYLPEVFPETSYRLTEMDPHNPYQALDNDSLITTLQPTQEVDDVGRAIYQAKVRINVWAEGWDADAMSAVKHDIVKIQLQFKVANLAQDEA